MAGEGKTKFAALIMAFVVIVAIAVGFFIMNRRNTEPQSEESQETDHEDQVKASIKAVCDGTDYKQTCVDSLTKAHTESTDPYQHIKTIFEVTIEQLEAAAQNSSVMKEVHADPRTNDALKGCKELAALAVDDLRRSFNDINIFNLNDVGQALEKLKIWMSGAITYEQTCLDGFEKTEGDTGDKMEKLLKQSMELTSNCLAMISEFSQIFHRSFGFGAPEAANNRRLLSLTNNDDNIPEWVDVVNRRILENEPVNLNPDVTIAQDGSGNFISINEALKFVPVKAEKMYVIYIKAGIYNEIIRIPKNLTHITMIGDGPDKTRITGSLNFIDGVSTYHTATVAVGGDFFMARDIGFENTAGPEKHQAVALRVSADRTVFYNCHMDGYQDTLYAHTYRQFYRECSISGTIDFVFGDSAAVFQNCVMVVRRPMDNQNCIVTAQGRKEPRQPTGLVLQNCSIVADPLYYPVRMQLKSYLGRPWKEYSRTIIMESFIDDLIQPQGWLPWNETFAFDTLFYTEFDNRGPGSSKLERVKWSGVKELTSKRLTRFTPGKFIMGDSWIPPTEVPYTSGFMFETPKDDDDSKKGKNDDKEKDDKSKKKKKKKKAAKRKRKKEERERKERAKKEKERSKSDSDSDKPNAPANSPGTGTVPESESDISAPGSSPSQSPEAISQTIIRKSFFQKHFGQFFKT